MGAPKQKWTAEEESALKAGIAKHGAGRWRTILKDPEFSGILILRSNVDLKSCLITLSIRPVAATDLSINLQDKWRNMCVMANGYGSREKVKLAAKKKRHIPKHDDNQWALSTMDDDDIEDEVFDVKPLAVSDALRVAGPKKPTPMLDNIILEAIAKLKEPTGSNKTAIALYIEENYWPPSNLREWLSEELNGLTASGRLIRVKRRYRIAPSASVSRGKSSKMLLLEGRQKGPSRSDRSDFKPLTKSQVDAELARMMNMTAEEAATFAAQAVAEAEAAMEDAEEAARQAESAEAEAEAAHAFAEAAMSTLKTRYSVNLNVPMVRV